MPRSSARFCSRIEPDPWLRLFVLGSAILLAACGAGLVASLPLPLHWRLLILAGFAGLTARELSVQLTACRRSRRFCLYCDATIDVECADGRRICASYAAGSVLLPGLVWLRIRAPDGSCWGELLAGNPRKNKDWRRLQVICRLMAPC